ncbi:hypothetical protein KUTeg_009427 [Tegillarca granosa]|uniref:FAD-binding domain-containing protein n=1 Tax=Tegillarca granosa TaxID=220873 RepID=A0ABQ9F3T9_TEGGR|nr:hypothetical protein KUTeg_009427 [Tegillarca granosa]
MDLATVAVVVAVAVVILILYVKLAGKRKRQIKEFPRKYPSDDTKNVDKEHYDVAIAGAGPAGAVCAYYLGKLGWKCLLLEKKKFPRDKYCGDAVCKTAIEILIDMGIYEQLIKEKKALSDNGGLVSPGGLSYIGRSKEELGEIPAALACKRILLDEAVAMAAKRMGADLREEWPVGDAKFDNDAGLWTVYKEGGDQTFKARYVFSASYAALFRHPNDELNYCCYIIPGNPKVKGEDLPYWHDHLLHKDPHISRAVGSDFKIERMKAASLRLGGEKVTYGNHLLIVGDAAGMIDPLTGEGIHHAMDGGKLAAEFLDEALQHGNYDKDVMSIYHDRWMDKFGFDFKWSMMFCLLAYRFPILLDASTAAIQRKGDKFLARWADIMTGRVPKIHMLKPEYSLTITFELMRLMVSRLFGFGKNQKKSE